jgi:hypothetical protein
MPAYMFQYAGYKNIPHSFWQYMTHAGYPQHFGIINLGRKRHPKGFHEKKPMILDLAGIPEIKICAPSKN